MTRVTVCSINGWKRETERSIDTSASRRPTSRTHQSDSPETPNRLNQPTLQINQIKPANTPNRPTGTIKQSYPAAPPATAPDAPEAALSDNLV